MKVEALFLHPYENYSGNILWAFPTNSPDFESLNESLNEIRKLGYWASAFPEGDGITFNHENYSKEKGLIDFSQCFSWMNFTVTLPDELSEKKTVLFNDRTTRCKVLVPVSKLWIEEEFSIGDFRFIPPVNNDNYDQMPHPWFELLTTDASSFIPRMNSLGQYDNSVNDASDLLNYPLIQCYIDLPLGEYMLAKTKLDAVIRIINLCSEKADFGLDLLRIAFCYFEKLEYLPNCAGQLKDGGTSIYLIPENSLYEPELFSHISHPILTSNNWLGLEAYPINDELSVALANIFNGSIQSEIANRIKGCIRAIRHSFYMVYDEARFLSLIFALDALCMLERNQTGWNQRTHISALASDGKVINYSRILRNYQELYNLRNKLVHQGLSFLELRESSLKKTDEVLRIILDCIKVLMVRNLNTKQEVTAFVNQVKSSPEFQLATEEIINEFGINYGHADIV